jgi:hypothetical protein
MEMTESEFWYWADVSRKAHELSDRHGWNAHTYAAKLAADALAEGKTEESEFWKAVEAALTPRRESY